MKDEKAKRALGIVFGVSYRDGLVHGIPGGIPYLRKVITCTTCEVEMLASGVPKLFSRFMTPAQKKQFKELMKG